MNDDLAASYEPETGQVILDGHPAGPAGEARLVPVTGVELAFDLTDGHLVRAIVADDNPSATAMLTRLLGPEAPGVLDAAKRQPAIHHARTGTGTLRPDGKVSAALSSLARLDAARLTSPVSCSSPWWAVEAAVLAQRAGLHARALAAARRAVCALDCREVAVPAEAARMALAAADILAGSGDDAVRRLHQNFLVLSEPHQPRVPGFDVAAEVEGLAKDCLRLPGLHWTLDPGLAPGTPFRPGLSPHSDLLVRHKTSAGRLVVTATPAPGISHETVSRWHARLVDPTVRRVLAVAVFEQAGSRVQAELHPPFPLSECGESWIEVVDRNDRPVRGAKLARIRRALRWADVALRAERAPAGLAPRSASSDWAALAAVAWQRCRTDWEAAGDTRRAAAAGVPRVPLEGPACLAEVLGE